MKPFNVEENRTGTAVTTVNFANGNPVDCTITMLRLYKCNTGLGSVKDIITVT